MFFVWCLFFSCSCVFFVFLFFCEHFLFGPLLHYPVVPLICFFIIFSASFLFFFRHLTAPCSSLSSSSFPSTFSSFSSTISSLFSSSSLPLYLLHPHFLFLLCLHHLFFVFFITLSSSASSSSSSPATYYNYSFTSLTFARPSKSILPSIKY